MSVFFFLGFSSWSLLCHLQGCVFQCKQFIHMDMCKHMHGLYGLLLNSNHFVLTIDDPAQQKFIILWDFLIMWNFNGYPFSTLVVLWTNPIISCIMSSNCIPLASKWECIFAGTFLWDWWPEKIFNPLRSEWKIKGIFMAFTQLGSSVDLIWIFFVVFQWLNKIVFV